jgi:hypothetical protein
MIVSNVPKNMSGAIPNSKMQDLLGSSENLCPSGLLKKRRL